MKGQFPAPIVRAVENFQELIQRVENGHSYATVNCVAFSPEELEAIRDFEMRSETVLQYPLSDYEGGHFRHQSNAEWPAALAEYLREVFDFNVRFSSKKEEAKKIGPEVDELVESIILFTIDAFHREPDIELRSVDKGGHNLARIDLKDEDRVLVFEFVYFID